LFFIVPYIFGNDSKVSLHTGFVKSELPFIFLMDYFFSNIVRAMKFI
jgi:hypothetical protein